jgi:outer membrane protein assembly factor BamB
MTMLRLLADDAGSQSLREPTGDNASSGCYPTTWKDRLAPLVGDALPLATLDPANLAALVRDLAFALGELYRGTQRQTSVLAAPNDGGASWEIGLERDGDDVLLSLFRQGSSPEVLVSERRLALGVVSATLDGLVTSAIDEAPAGSLRAGLALAHGELGRLARETAAPAVAIRREAVRLESSGRRRLRLRCDILLRCREAESGRGVARADLHSLLFRGRLSAAVGKSRIRLLDAHVFLVAELLLDLAQAAFEARSEGRAILRKSRVAAQSCGIRLDEKGALALLLGDGVMPVVLWHDFVHAALSFGRRLAKRVVLADPAQAANLRLVSFRSQLRELEGRLKGADSAASQLNDMPESYRAFAASDRKPAPATPRSLGKLRFSESWRADVPGIDLSSLALAGDLVMVASRQELAAIDRNSGQLVWRRRSQRAVSIMTPAGLVRLAADGQLTLHQLGDGEPSCELRLGPCAGASTSGAVMHAPGLPRMMLVSEGTRHLAAVDLDAHQVRWRRALRRSARLRIRRAGKLAIVAAGEPALWALDLLSGETVWRYGGRMRYLRGATVDGGELYALSSEVEGRPGMAALERIDPWTGELCWRRALPRRTVVASTALVGSDVVAVMTRDGRHLGVVGFERASGELLFDRGGVCEGSASYLAIDDLLIVNSGRSELVGLDLAGGSLRYRLVFAGARAAGPHDRPRSLQPILRAGALFIPQTEVYVVRPQDGALLGQLPMDLVPDALCVDERCGAYVAEASGYLAAFRALPTLSLVTPA